MRRFVRHRTVPQLVLDLISLQAAFYSVVWLRFQSGLFENPLVPGGTELFIVGLVLTLFWLAVYALRGLYNPRELSASRFEAVAHTFRATVIGMLILFVITFDPTEKITLSRTVLFTYGGLVFLFVSAGRVAFRSLIIAGFQRGKWMYQCVQVGFDETGRSLFRQLKNNPRLGFDVQAIFTENFTPDEDGPTNRAMFKLDHLERYLDEQNNHPPVELVLLALDSMDHDLTMELLDKLQCRPVRILTVPDFYQSFVGLARGKLIQGTPLMEVYPKLLTPTYAFIKRTIDILTTSLILLVSSPVLLFAMLLIKLDSRGPVIYRQERVGRHGRIFTLFKLRTMVSDAEKGTGPVWARLGDKRVTRVGIMLRRMRIDELPQLFNVLKGDMSLVGPRPERPVFVEKFIDTIPFYGRRLQVRPGVTGWAQTRHGYDESEEDVKVKLRYDLYYLENMSVGLDIKILVGTVVEVLQFRGR
ncbi:exopolysaccharide biosynthesis polyprenyl glycosylphosphotransferase [bacterium]|nr:exopolysaccharide biosynthesis polyprenyl glycosylphosphotransferase [bacterium]